MPPKGVKLPCITPGCPHYAEPGSRYSKCSVHEPTYEERKAAGERVGSTRVWRELRKRAWVHQHGRCLVCECPLAPPSHPEAGGARWDLHHLDGNARNNTSRNLAALCRPCHFETFKR